MDSELTQMAPIHDRDDGVRDIRILARMRNLACLCLARNDLILLEPLSSCTQLRVLDLSHNPIWDLREVGWLAGLYLLRWLSLKGCPCTQSPLYRSRVLELLPRLDHLDDQGMN